MSNSARAFWYRCLNEPSIDFLPSLIITAFLSLMILLNILEVVLGSMPGFREELGDWVLIVNICFVVVFLVEYLLRYWVAAETPHVKPMTNGRKRWLYVVSPMGVIDLLSFLPLLLLLLLPGDAFGDLRILKLISMVRVLKLTRYSASLLMIARVFRENKNTLLAAGMVMMILMFIAATGIYICEKGAQPEAFGTIPACLWWAVVTLTTVGYGDVTPITFGGQLFGAIVMVCGVGIAAMPAGIFASSFVQLVREQERERRRKLRIRRGHLKVEAGPDSEEEPALHLSMTQSEQREVAYLVSEYGLTLDQATGVVSHFRH